MLSTLPIFWNDYFKSSTTKIQLGRAGNERPNALPYTKDEINVAGSLEEEAL